MNDATKYVASRSHPTLKWSNSVLIEGDVAESIAVIKQQDGPKLQVHGSGNLIQTLLRHNLVDRYRLWVFPAVLGSGKLLFSEGAIPSGLKLVDSKVSTTGVMIGGTRSGADSTMTPIAMCAWEAGALGRKPRGSERFHAQALSDGMCVKPSVRTHSECPISSGLPAPVWRPNGLPFWNIAN